MKTLGFILILGGVLCAASIVTGAFAWTSPVAGNATAASLADVINWRTISFSGLGFLLFTTGMIALVLGRKSR